MTLEIASVDLLRDQIPTDGSVLPPERYVVRPGLSRSLTAIERQQIINDPSTRLAATTDLMYLDAPDTSLEEIWDRLPELDSLLARIESEAQALQEASNAASDALTVAHQSEVIRRVRLRAEINESLKQKREGDNRLGGATHGGR